jgi:hypothetical protein
MDQAFPGQPPAVVLRSRYTLMRALLGIAIIAVVALTVAVVVLANGQDDASGTSSAQSIHPIEYGGFSPNTGRPESAPLPRGGVAPPPSSIAARSAEGYQQQRSPSGR